MIRPTGSKVHRIWMCPASAVMPQNISDEREERTEPARGRGQIIHGYLERVRALGSEEALSGVPWDLAVLCRALDIDRLPTHLSCEVAMAWDWTTGTARELGRSPDLPRRPDNAVDYDALGVDWTREVPTTIDVTGMAEFSPPGSMEAVRRGYIGDYKTGHTRYVRPKVNGQILIGAICIRYLQQLDDVIGELIYIDEDGESFPQRDVIDAWTLDSFERDLAIVMEDLPRLAEIFRVNGGGALAKREGRHCDHCPAWKDCSAKTALVRAVPEQLVKLGARRTPAGELELTWVPELGKDGKPIEGKGAWDLQLSPGAITARNSAAAYEAVEAIERLCKRVKEEICGIAWHEPIPLTDGRVIERYVTKRRVVEGRIGAGVAERWLVSIGKSPDIARAKVAEKLEIKLSIEAVKDLISENVDWAAKPRPVIESKKGTGVLDKLLVDLERAGGLHVNSSEECKPHRVRGRKT